MSFHLPGSASGSCARGSRDIVMSGPPTEPSLPHSADGSSEAALPPGGFSALGLGKAPLEGLLIRVNMLHQLASLSISRSSASVSESKSSNPAPTVQPAMSYARVLSAPKAVSFTPNDIRSLPRLTGSVDVDVAEVLSQFRLIVGFRAEAVAPHDDFFAKNLAFERLSLVCDGPCLTYQHSRLVG